MVSHGSEFVLPSGGAPLSKGSATIYNTGTCIRCWTSCLGVLVVAIVASKVLYVVYSRLYIHPLRTLPGPFLARVTNLYAAYYAFHGRLHLQIHRLHERYGHTVRLGPNRVITNLNSSYQAIYSARNYPNLPKSPLYMSILTGPDSWNVHNAINQDLHARRRKIVGHALGSDFPEMAGRVAQEKIGLFLENIERTLLTRDYNWTEPMDMTMPIQCLVLDLMTTLSIGKDLDLQGRPENRFAIEFLIAFFRLNSAYASSLGLIRLRLEYLVYAWGIFRGWKLFPTMWAFVRNRESYSAKNDIKCIKDRIEAADGMLSKTPTLSSTALMAEVKFVLITGGISTASPLASTLFYVTGNPGIYEKLVQEIFTAFESEEDITATNVLAKCTYLHACVTEALRMTPSTGAAPMREIQKHGITIATSDGVGGQASAPDTQYFPPGVEIGTGIYAIQHNERNFKNSFEYLPDRWLRSRQEAADDGDQLNAYAAFLHGPRTCLGQKFVYTTVMLALARLIWRFDVRRASGEAGLLGAGNARDGTGRHRPNEFQHRDFILPTFAGPCLQFRRRRL